jgi:hypothetical protein
VLLVNPQRQEARRRERTISSQPFGAMLCRRSALAHRLAKGNHLLYDVASRGLIPQSFCRDHENWLSVTSKETENIMNRTFNILTRTESTVTAVCASLLSVVTVGAVMALFATATHEVAVDRVVLEPVVITATKSA